MPVQSCDLLHLHLDTNHQVLLYRHYTVTIVCNMGCLLDCQSLVCCVQVSAPADLFANHLQTIHLDIYDQSHTWHI